MKLLTASFICFFLFFSAALAQSDGDTCHVYVMDVKKIEQFRNTTDFDAFMKKAKPEQEKLMKAAGLTTFEEFVTKVAEEETTTRTYPFPGTKSVITASVFYTDESMGSTNSQESMLLGISVSAKAGKDAFEGEAAALAEITYDNGTDTVRVKKNLIVDSRLYVVGLECRCKKTNPPAKN